MKTANFGSVSSGTLRPEDLIPAFARELRRLRGALPRTLATDIKRLEKAWVPDEPAAEILETAAEILETLTEELEAYAPPYGYFGAHPYDGAAFGFWPSETALEDFDGLRVSDTSEIPHGYRGEVMHVNDHGNVTLYVANSRGLREVWAIV